MSLPVPEQLYSLTPEHFYSAAELAKRWKVSKMTVYRLIDSGELPAISVGRAKRVRGSDVDRFERKGQIKK